MTDYIGKIIGGCSILRKIDEGGMGVVYEAEQSSLSRKVAIKFLSSNLAHNEDFVLRFFREAKSAACLTHPNVLQVFNVGKEDDVVYMITELVRGKTLKQLVNEKGVFLEKEALPIIRDIASALNEAARNNIVHRDIKPNNVMLTDNNIVKVMDFGLAKSVTSETQAITNTGAILGTPQYMSPEQIKGEGVDIRSDIYSLGLVLYFILTGKPAFDGKSSVTIYHDQVYSSLPDPKKINPNISEQVRNIIIKMTKKKPEDRFQSSREIVEAIDLIIKDPKMFTAVYKKEKIDATIFIAKKSYKHFYVFAIVIVFLVLGIVGFYFKQKEDVNERAATITDSSNINRSDINSLKPYEDYLSEGEKSFNKNELEKALKIFEEAQKLYPNGPETEMWIDLVIDKRSKILSIDISKELIIPGTLKILISEFSPFYFKSNDNKPKGFDVELLNRFAKEMGLKADFVDVSLFKDVFPSFFKNEGDIVAGGITITDKRKQTINFSRSYFASTLVLYVKSGSSIKKIEDIKDKKIGFVSNTTSEKKVHDLKIKNTVGFDDLNALFLAVKNGDIDAFINDLAEIKGVKESIPDIEVAFTLGKIENYGYGLKKDSDSLKEALDLFIDKMEKKGMLKKIFDDLSKN
ncbi:MAG: transporter substrate-binding domain-containing protein [Candidatus Aureabacteria bacterium]|nr:transporter substrate-binding domain-containing protein [Candidatus Auribacterota bacterium]